jgi:hypothetical protein
MGDFIDKLFQSPTMSTCLERFSTNFFADLADSTKKSSDIIIRKNMTNDAAEYI